MKKLLVSFMTILMFFTIAGCAGEGSGVKTYTDASQPVDIRLDSEFIISLPSNPTTGYTWTENHDEAMLKMVDKSYQQNEASKGMVGAGGTEHLRFKALKSGETKITLVYRRPWEQPSSQDKTAVFTVRIK